MSTSKPIQLQKLAMKPDNPKILSKPLAGTSVFVSYPDPDREYFMFFRSGHIQLYPNIYRISLYNMTKYANPGYELPLGLRIFGFDPEILAGTQPSNKRSKLIRAYNTSRHFFVIVKIFNHFIFSSILEFLEKIVIT
jgi:hypothetical protein